MSGRHGPHTMSRIVTHPLTVAVLLALATHPALAQSASADAPNDKAK